MPAIATTAVSRLGMRRDCQSNTAAVMTAGIRIARCMMGIEFTAFQKKVSGR